MMPTVRSCLKDNVGLVALFSVLTASLSLNVALGWRLRGASPSLKRGGVQEQSLLPEIPAVDANGRRVVLSFAESRGTVLYVLSPSCRWCQKNSANIRALAAARGGDLRFVGLSTRRDRLPQYLAEHPVGFPVYSLESEALTRSLGLLATPQTVVVGTGGRVEKVWVGAFLPESQAEVERFFDVKLPGLEEVVADRSEMGD